MPVFCSQACSSKGDTIWSSLDNKSVSNFRKYFYILPTVYTVHPKNERDKMLKAGLRAIHSAFVCYFFILNDSCQTSYLTIYLTDLSQIFTVGRTMAVDDQPVISFSVPQGMLPWQPNFVGFSTWCHWTQAASGAVGWANVWLCPALATIPCNSSFMACFADSNVHKVV